MGIIMILYGTYSSPFVRRVATTLKLYDIEYRNIELKTSNAEHLYELKKKNPLGRVPAFEIDSGELLIDSVAILDYLDRLIGDENSLIPSGFEQRTRVMTQIGILTGAMEKAVSAVYEIEKRPKDKIHSPWLQNLYQQTKDGMEAVDKMAIMPWINGEKMTQSDVSGVIFWDSIRQVWPTDAPVLNCPKLIALSEKANAMSAFSETYQRRNQSSRR